MTLLDHSIRGSRPVSSWTVAAPPDERLAEILSDDALAFVGELHERFGARRRELLQARAERGAPSGFLEETREIREDGDWQVPPPRPDYEDRRVEITGPTDRKLVINALNSGAKGFMADFEDANSPTWRNQVEGHVNLIDAIEGTITYDGSDGKHYELDDEPATLLVRPRGWHLPEKHLHDRRRADRRRAHGLRPATRSTAARRARRRATAASTSTCPRWSTTSRRALWNDVFTLHRRRARRCRPADPRHGADRDAPGRVPDGRRSSTSWASTPTGSTPAAGTTSSR